MRLDIYKRKWHNSLLTFVRMPEKIDLKEMKESLFKMAEDIFDFQYQFGDASITYMLLQHARDDMLAVTEILDLPEYL